MEIADFEKFFTIIHGYSPFPWQKRMMSQVAESGWMDNINLPTSSGKTSVLDIAVFYMAFKAERGQMPYRRIFYTVDRRFVVDEAYEEAMAMRKKLIDHANDADIVGKVSSILSSMGEDNSPLCVLRLRGGIRHEPVFISNPLQPAVVVSTVDQVGSRMLFRGYGVSDYMRPVHAALIGMDSLIIMDEAHLSRPFYETVEYVRRYQSGDWAQETVGNQVQIVSMSATPYKSDSRTFSLNEDDYSNETLSKRFKSTKNVTIINRKLSKEDMEDCNNPSVEKKVAGIFADTAMDLMKKLLAKGETAPVVGIVVNSVSFAGAVYSLMSAKSGSDTVKIIGRTRPYERDQIISKYLPRIKVSRDPYANPNPLYVIATQTVEVGANIDFDALITEIAPLDALRQRFGRLNRIGKHDKAVGAIIRCNCRDKVNEGIYGKAPEETMKWLNRIAKNHSVDFGINAMSDILSTENQNGLNVQKKHAPVMLPSHLDALVQTSPSPSVSPDISEMLHGTSVSPADLQVLWRDDISESETPDDGMVFETFSMIPPRSYETVSVPIWSVRNFLMGLARIHPDPDIEGTPTTDTEDKRDGKKAFLWTGDEDSRFIEPGEINPGDTIILSTKYGGYDEYGWNHESTAPVKDIAEIAVSHDTGQIVQRMHPAIMANWFVNDGETKKKAESLLSTCITSLMDGENTEETVSNFLKDLAELPLDYELLDRMQSLWKTGKRRISFYPDRKGIVIESPEKRETDLADDDSSSYIGEISLEYHSNGVKEQVGKYSQQLVRDPTLDETLKTAGFLHDLGKADPRFQSWLRGGIPYDGGNLLAKSNGKRDLNLILKARQLSRYPQGGRHECYSAAILRGNPALLKGNVYNDLILYLVGTHHGRGRAMMPVTEDTGTAMSFVFGGEKVEYNGIHGMDSIDSGWTDLFWKIIRKYGYWGSAYLEMILRLGDHTESSRETENGREK
jgi:CRISPR-associated endonuclease/helicase Cas3